VHIDTYDDATWVYTFGPGSFVTVAFVLLAVAMFVAFMVVMIRHAYAEIIAHEPVEPGPAVEGEPTVY
jgi:hypothetical protein